jgi:hypothetical protein
MQDNAAKPETLPSVPNAVERLTRRAFRTEAISR